MQAAGCITIKRRTEVKKEEIRPQLESSEQSLLASYNNQVRAVQSLQATVDLVPSTGSTYSGVIEEYHDVPGFILAERPATVRVIGQAPVVAKNIFDMVSDGKNSGFIFRRKTRSWSGPRRSFARRKSPSKTSARSILLKRCSGRNLPASANVLFEQFDFSVNRYYILTLLRPAEGGKFEIARKIWFDRADLRVSRVQLYGAEDGSIPTSLIRTGSRAARPAARALPRRNGRNFPARHSHLASPGRLQARDQIMKLTLNQPISAGPVRAGAARGHRTGARGRRDSERYRGQGKPGSLR